MRRIHAVIGAVTVVLCATALAGCAAAELPPRSGAGELSPPSESAEAPPAPDAEPAAAVDCRTEWSPMLQGADSAATADPGIATPGRVPAGFEASAALLCSNLDRVALEGAMRITADVARLEGDLVPLLDALAQPDGVLPSNLSCTADMEVVPALWLEGRDGMVIPVHYPRDGCGKTTSAVRGALDDLETTDVSRLDWPAG